MSGRRGPPPEREGWWCTGGSCFWAVGPFEKRRETLAPSQQKLQMQKRSAFASVWGCLLSPGTRPGPQVESPDETVAGLPPAGFRAAGAAGGGSGRRVPAWSQFCLPSPPGTRAQQAFLTCGRPPAAPACSPRRRQTAPQSPPDTRQLPDSHSSATRCDVAAWLPLPGQETEAERGCDAPGSHGW